MAIFKAIPRWHANPYLWVAALAFGALAIPFCTRAHSEWDTVYVRSAADLLAGRDVYLQPHGYTYPPFQMALALPFVALPHGASRLLWYALNVASFAWMVSAAWAIAGGRPLRGAAAWSQTEHAIFLLGLGCGLWYSLHALAHQQTDLLVAAFVFGGCRMVQTGRSWRGAALIGLGAAMKCTPLLFVPYLAFRRRFAAAALVVVAAIGVSLLPDLVSRSPQRATWLSEWYALYLRPMSSREYTPGIWASDVLYNQSLAGGINRWLLTEWTWSSPAVTVAAVDASTDAGRLKTIILGVEFILAAAAGLLFCRRLRLTPEAGAGDAAWAGLEYGVVALLMLLFSPMSSIPHFCTLILPGFCLARQAVLRRDKVAGLFVGVALVLAALSNKDLQGARLYTLTLWHGLVMANALVLLAGLMWTLARRPPEIASSVAEQPTRIAA